MPSQSVTQSASQPVGNRIVRVTKGSAEPASKYIHFPVEEAIFQLVLSFLGKETFIAWYATDGSKSLANMKQQQ